ncbi:hypothetical protein [uncultured Bacteroides sp.]|uniref:hypothetical protein n=1 Tax=uncultured Bacteroides sp. TaxID=162156 RepID=UPI00261B89D3|nr:hypothetical protein [uncultured Bacteroides sp.]
MALLGMFTSCNDEWGNDNPEMEHIYYYGLGNESFPGGNELKYTVQQGSIIAIPTYFFSVFNRPYSPEVYYYTSTVPNSDPQLVCGEDYVVVDSNGNTLTPGSDGAYKMIWPNAVGGSQNVYIKALNGQKGFLRVLTFDPNKTIVATDVSSTTIIKTEEYEVRAFTENYYVTVEIK